MQRERKRKATEGGYKYVSDDMRKFLLDSINDNPKMTLKEAAKNAGIKYSTAKTIKRVYLIEKRITKKPNPRRSKLKLRKAAKKKKIFLVHHLTCPSTSYEIQKDSDSNVESVVKRKGKSSKKKLVKHRILRFKTSREKRKNLGLAQAKIEELRSNLKGREVFVKEFVEIYELYIYKGVLEFEIIRNHFDINYLELLLKYYYSVTSPLSVVS